MKRYMNRPRPIISSWDKLPLLMTTGETSALLDIPEDSVRRKCREGKLPAIRIGALYQLFGVSSDYLLGISSSLKQHM